MENTVETRLFFFTLAVSKAKSQPKRELMARLKKGYSNQLVNEFAAMVTTVPPSYVLIF